jgi:hypothetical protein
MLLAMYSFFSILVLLVNHGMWAQGGRLVVQEFPQENLNWLWLSNCRCNIVSSILFGTIAGLLLAFIVYTFVNSGIQQTLLIKKFTRIVTKVFSLSESDDTYFHIVVAFLCTSAFFVVYLLLAWFCDTHLLLSISDLGYLSAFAGTTAISAANSVFSSRKPPVFSKRAMELKYIELEHASARERMHTIAWSATTGLIAVMVASALNAINGVNKAILGSEGYSICLTGTLLGMLTLIVGIGCGILYQFWYQLDKVTERIKQIDTRKGS